MANRRASGHSIGDCGDVTTGAVHGDDDDVRAARDVCASADARDICASAECASADARDICASAECASSGASTECTSAECASADAGLFCSAYCVATTTCSGDREH